MPTEAQGWSPNAGPAKQLQWSVADAGVAERKGDWESAVRAYEAAAAIQDGLARVQGSRQLMERVLGPSHDLACRLAYARSQAGDIWGALAALENGRARLLMPKLARLAYRAAHRRSGERTGTLASYEAVWREVEEFEAIRDRGVADMPEGATSRGQRLSALGDEITARIRRLPGFEWFGLKESAHSMPRLLAGHDVVYMFHAEPGGRALVHLSSARGHLIDVPLPQATTARVTEMANRFREALGQLESSYGSALTELDVVCRWLGSAVVGPLIPALGNRTFRRLMIVPCAWFSILPVHSAWCMDNKGKGRRYPLIDIGTTYIPNMQAARALNSIPAADISRNVLVVSEPPSPRADLPASVEEGIAVTRAWPSSHTAWRKDDVLAAVPGCTLVHFAAHGLSRPDQPLRSGIQVAYGRWLEVHELMAVQFRSFPLCVLSACRTAAIGHTVPDEGTGLVSGLLSAGARGAVASMWPVDDFATRIFMTYFHNALSASRNVPAALRAAQHQLRSTTLSQLAVADARELADDSSPRDSCPFEHPLFWAGFCYTGI